MNYAEKTQIFEDFARLIVFYGHRARSADIENGLWVKLLTLIKCGRAVSRRYVAVALRNEYYYLCNEEQRHKSGVFQYEETEDINAGIPFDGIELKEAAEALTPKQRETLILHRVHGFTFAEIAARRGCSKQAVSRQEKHALDKLRAVL